MEPPENHFGLWHDRGHAPVVDLVIDDKIAAAVTARGGIEI